MAPKLIARVSVFCAMAALTPSLLLIPSRQTAQSGARLLNFSDKFEGGNLDAWQMPYPEDWVILGEPGRHYLHMKRNRDPGVPRRPLQFALLKNIKAGSFDLRVRVRREGGSMIVVFNYVDTLHFYYSHLSVDSGRKQAVHNGIFLVNNAPRVRIAGAEAIPALPDTSWHQIRVLRNGASGRIEVWSDVQAGVLFTVVDHTYSCGQIGLGSFDETGDFSDVDLSSNDSGCKPAAP
ncbi:MAG TPA: hypothetical protein VG206_12585 [Terriglobia bacterium]|nr:hypothetical protein [Terriglobia bacterium]